MQLDFIASENFISSIAAMNFYNVMDLTLYLIFICMYFLVLKNTHRTELYKMSDYQLPINTMLMFIFIVVNKVSTHKIPLLTGVFEYHLTTSYPAIRILFKNGRSRVCGSSKETALYVQLCVHYQEAFDPVEVKSNIIESKGISKKSENSEGFSLEDDRICANYKIVCL